jgi:hypothetical protein
VFSPAGGTYTTAQSVKITDATTGAIIYYTTNGSTPTASSTKYSGAIKVSMTETLKAIAVAAGHANSSVATARYTLKTATPVFSPAGGTYTTAQSVKITDATAGATIYYTTNGNTPTTSSTKYSGAIKVSTTETLKAIAVAAGHANSSVATARYTLKTATSVLSPAGGTYTTAQIGEDHGCDRRGDHLLHKPCVRSERRLLGAGVITHNWPDDHAVAAFVTATSLSLMARELGRVRRTFIRRKAEQKAKSGGS